MSLRLALKFTVITNRWKLSNLKLYTRVKELNMQSTIVKSTTATIQNGVMKADGKFWITQTNVNFEPFNEKLGLEPHTIPRNTILKVVECKGKGAGLIPITADAIEVFTQDGSSYQFILSNPSDWITILSNQTSA